MCQFFSALVLRNGDVLAHWAIDSHSQLAEHFNLRDDGVREPFAKVELVPGANNWLDPQCWDFRLDEPTRPDWWAEVAEGAERKVRARALAMVRTEGVLRHVHDGCYILGGMAEIREMLGGRVMMMRGSSNVGAMCGSSKVGVMRESSKVGRDEREV